MNKNNHYPSGKLNEDDEGATPLMITVQGDVVMLDFGKQLKWIGLYKEQAIELAKAIMSHAMMLPNNDKH